MTRARGISALVAATLSLGGLVVVGAPAGATINPCTPLSGDHPIAGDFTNQTYQNANGVNSQIFVPTISQLSNVGTTSYSIADIYISGVDGGFVQFGWYYGQTTTGLTKKTTINAFGEKVTPARLAGKNSIHSAPSAKGHSTASEFWRASMSQQKRRTSSSLTGRALRQQRHN